MDLIKNIVEQIGLDPFPRSVINSTKFGEKYVSQHITKKTNRVLELGSGSCLLITLLSIKYKNVSFSGIDPNIDGFSIYSKIKNKLIQKFDLNITNKYDSPKISGKYDLIFAIDMIEHVENVETIFSFVKKHLAKDGKFIVICPNASFWYEPHFSLPIIINKKFTYLFFKNYIEKSEIKNDSIGLWKSLNFINARKLEAIGEKFYFNRKFNSNISSELILRVAEDLDFKKRKFFVWFLAFIVAKTSLVKILNIRFLIMIFPYIYVEFSNK